MMDATSFVLCADCLEKYRALRFDPDAGYSLNVMPLCSLVWPDEHPGGELPSGEAHRACKGTIIRLAGARTRLWRTGSLPENRTVLWKEAQRQLPDWPGFHRLTLSPEELESLDGCREELDDLMGAVGRQFSTVTLTSKDGITHFRAERVVTRPPRFSAAWWFRGVEHVGSVLQWIVIGGIIVWLCVAVLRAVGLVN